MLLGICDMSLVKSSDLLDIKFMIMRKCNKRQQSGKGIDKNHLSVIVCVFFCGCLLPDHPLVSIISEP